MKGHETSAGAYFWTWVALVVLAVATYLLSRLDLGAWKVPVALAIAVAKGLFVVLVFMHLLEHRSTSRVYFSVAFGFIVLLVSLTTTDVIMRDPIEKAPASAGP